MRNNKNKHLYNKLKESRPSVFRMSLLTWLMWLAGNLVGLACFILGMAIFIDTTFGKKLLTFINDNLQVADAEPGTHRISLFLASVFMIAGVLFWIIAFLSRRLLIRNKYIVELEELMDDEMEKKILQSAADSAPKE